MGSTVNAEQKCGSGWMKWVENSGTKIKKKKSKILHWNVKDRVHHQKYIMK